MYLYSIQDGVAALFNIMLQIDNVTIANYCFSSISPNVIPANVSSYTVFSFGIEFLETQFRTIVISLFFCRGNIFGRHSLTENLLL